MVSWVPQPNWDLSVCVPGGAPAFLEPGTEVTTGAGGRVTLAWLNPSGDSDVLVTEQYVAGPGRRPQRQRPDRQPSVVDSPAVCVAPRRACAWSRFCLILRT